MNKYVNFIFINSVILRKVPVGRDLINEQNLIARVKNGDTFNDIYSIYKLVSSNFIRRSSIIKTNG